MNKVILLGIAGLGLATTAGLVLGSDDYVYVNGKWRELRADIAPVRHELYQEECGSCHFVYQPGLLPARSWDRIMAGLEDHFGDNAELDEDDARAIRKHLSAHAADNSPYMRSAKIMRSLDGDEAPLRITETRYFKHKHREVPDRLVFDNIEVGSFSNCQACHTNAADGRYDDDEVNIAGYGRWDD